MGMLVNIFLKILFVQVSGITSNKFTKCDKM